MPQIHKVQRLLYITTRIVKHVLIIHCLIAAKLFFSLVANVTGKSLEKLVLFVVELGWVSCLSKWMYLFLYNVNSSMLLVSVVLGINNPIWQRYR